eukprot:scaffold308561_cov19-Tisochrysis_lutea.AAC.1
MWGSQPAREKGNRRRMGERDPPASRSLQLKKTGRGSEGPTESDQRGTEEHTFREGGDDRSYFHVFSLDVKKLKKARRRMPSPRNKHDFKINPLFTLTAQDALFLSQHAARELPLLVERVRRSNPC